MATVAIHPPKTPVHKGSHTIAKATIPNICKMPGPPAPFVPAPLPNIAKSELSPKDYSTTVEIEGNTVAIRGATFESIGDMASKGTGGGLISANCHGPAKFISPGSMTVKIEGKNVHLLGEPMLNNLGPSGSPPNTGATMMGADHADLSGGDPPDSECAKIAAKIDELINAEKAPGSKDATSGLKFRFAQQLTGSMPPGSPGWNTHHNNIVQQQQALNKEIARHDNMKPPCKTPLPAGTRDWGARRPPSAIDYKNYGAAPGTQLQFGGGFM